MTLSDTQRPTSFDVARAAGLSRSTVSQVLNGNEDRFPAETRERVRSAAAKLGYRPSRAGRALVTGVSDVVVVAVPNVTFGRHLQDAVDRIAQATASRGMSVVVRYAGSDVEASMTAILDLRPAVVVDLGVFPSKEQRRLIEATGTRILPKLDVLDHALEHPYHLIGRLQALHLLQDPRRHLVVATIDEARSDPSGPDRQQGVADVAREAGAGEPLVMAVPLTRAGAVKALTAVLAAYPGEPIGVCCYNDDVAIAVLAAARQLNVDVPGEVAVVGVDHTDVGQLFEPSLTSVSVDLPGMLSLMLGGLDTLRAPDADADHPLDFGNLVRLIPGESG